MDESKPVGEVIREHRQAAGYSLRVLAKSVGISFPHLSKVESGSEVASEQLIRDLAHALDIDEDTLMIAARRVPSDLAETLLAKSDRGAAEFLRTWRDGGITDEQVGDLLRGARENGGPHGSTNTVAN